MPIRVKCPSCRSQMQVPDGSSGKQTRCPQCQTVLRIPAAAPASPPTSVAAGAVGGAIRIRCPRCSTTLAAPASAAGKTVRCSSCQTQLRVPATPSGAASDLFPAVLPPEGGGLAPAASPFPPGPASAGPTLGGGDLDWDALGSLPPAAAPPAAAPYLPPASAPRAPYRPPAAVRTRGSLPSGREAWHYVVPAAFILLWGVLMAIGQIVRLGIVGWMIAQHGMPANAGPVMTQVGLGIVFAILGSVMAVGSVAMIQRTNLGAARGAAMLAAIPCFGCFVMPFGIWACVLMYSAAAERDFE